MTDNDNHPAGAPRPQDDLFLHVNGAWLAEHSIADDRSSAGSFVTLRDGAEEAVRTIVEGLDPAEPGDRGRVAALYRCFMDESTIEQLGATPLAALLDRVDGIRSTTDLARHWGWALGNGLASLFALVVDADMDEPQQHALSFAQSGLGLPDRDFYTGEDSSELLAAYQGHVERSLALAGIEDAAAQAEQVLELETDIAACHWTKVQSRDIQSRHNPTDWASFRDSAPALLLDEVLAGAGIDPARLTRLDVWQPSFHQQVADLVTDDRLPQWRAWARWCLVRSLAAYLSSDFVAERFAFYGHTLQGTPELTPRWKRGVALVEGALGETIGQIYVEDHFPSSSKERMDGLVGNLLKAYAASIEQLDWMGEQTRAEALRKLAGFNPKIGYPPKWRDYSALELVPDDLVASVLAIGRFELAEDLDRLSRPVDPDEWQMLPQTVNAYYHPLRNEIVFPAAILQPPFFDPEADDATNYGGIGSVIGHEIGHGFDDQGSTCDGDGRLRNWWTDEDRSAFTERTSALIAQFDALTPRDLMDDEPRPHVNGRLTIGENIGDLGGLTIALKALQIAQHGTLDSTMDPDQARALFVGYARIWCSKYRPEMARQLLVIDPHSPAEFRCNQISRNLDIFHDVFETIPGDGMWLEPEQRVSIW